MWFCDVCGAAASAGGAPLVEGLPEGHVCSGCGGERHSERPGPLRLSELPYLGKYLRSGGVDRFLTGEMESRGTARWWLEELVFVALTASVPIVSFALGYAHALTLAVKATATVLLALSTVVFFAGKRRRRRELLREWGRLPASFRDAALGRAYRGFAFSYALFILVIVPAMWLSLLHPSAAYAVDLLVGACALAEVYLMASHLRIARLPRRLHGEVLAVEAMAQMYDAALRRFEFLSQSERRRGLSFANKEQLQAALLSFERKLHRAAMLLDHQMEGLLTFEDEPPSTFAANLAALDTHRVIGDELLESMMAEVRLLQESEAGDSQV